MHVHVYKVVEMWEIETSQTDAESARKEALQKVKDGKEKQKSPDCEYIALTF